MKIKICDICGQPIIEPGDLIIKKSWASWEEFGYGRLEVCRDCTEDLRQWIEEKRRNAE